MNWKPISEKPTAGVDVLLWEESGRFCKGHCGPEGKFWAWSDGYREVDCSHWSLITPPSEGVEQLTQLIPHDGKSMAEFLSLDAAAKRIRALRQHTVPLEEVYAEWTGSGKWQAHQADLQRVAYAAIESPDPSTALAEALEELVTAFERPSRQFLDSTRVEMEPWLKQARAALALHRKATT